MCLTTEGGRAGVNWGQLAPTYTRTHTWVLGALCVCVRNEYKPPTHKAKELRKCSHAKMCLGAPRKWSKTKRKVRIAEVFRPSDRATRWPSQVTSCRQESKAERTSPNGVYICIHIYIIYAPTPTWHTHMYIPSVHMYAKLYQNIQISIDFAVKLTWKATLKLQNASRKKEGSLN